jgi:UDP-N-acetylglucosamine 2-epimerase
LSPDDYLRVLCNTACAVGNSSSFVRDAGYFGTPIVLVGDRQKGREFDRNVTPAPAVSHDIARSIRSQLAHGRYEPSDLYGDGNVSRRIAMSLAALHPYIQKRLHYVEDERPATVGSYAGHALRAAGD